MTADARPDFVRWDQRHSVDFPKLDRQHQRVLGLINDLYKAVDRGNDTGPIAAIISQLSDYTVYHFNTEEYLLQKTGYAELDAHRAAHEEMRAKLPEFQILLKRKDPQLGTQLLSFLKEWWLLHILKVDKAYAVALAKGSP